MSNKLIFAGQNDNNLNESEVEHRQFFTKELGEEIVAGLASNNVRIHNGLNKCLMLCAQDKYPEYFYLVSTYPNIFNRLWQEMESKEKDVKKAFLEIKFFIGHVLGKLVKYLPDLERRELDGLRSLVCVGGKLDHLAEEMALLICGEYSEKTLAVQLETIEQIRKVLR